MESVLYRPNEWHPSCYAYFSPYHNGDKSQTYKSWSHAIFYAKMSGKIKNIIT